MTVQLLNIALFMAQNFEETYREVVAARAEQFLGIQNVQMLLVFLLLLTVLTVCCIILVIILIVYHIKKMKALRLYMKSSNMD